MNTEDDAAKVRSAHRRGAVEGSVGGLNQFLDWTRAVSAGEVMERRQPSGDVQREDVPNPNPVNGPQPNAPPLDVVPYRRPSSPWMTPALTDPPSVLAKWCNVVSLPAESSEKTVPDP